MTSSAEYAMPLDMLDDFLAFTLAGKKPELARQGACANGVRWSWLDDGILLLAPSAVQEASAPALRSVLVSAGVHGDETAPIELLNRLARDIADGTARLNCRLLIVLGNIDAMRDACRHLDDDLNRLFCGRHTQVPQSREAPRAIALERAAQAFFDGAPNTPGARWHIDMHTAIRASAFEQFALLPVTGAPVSRAMFEWLGKARISAVLLHTTRGNTYSQFTAQACGALACTLELGKVRPFGQNDLTRFAGADEAVRHLLAGTNDAVNSTANAALPRAFTVVDQITKQSDAFELLVAPDVANFTPFARGTLLARDGAYCYTVRHDEERIVFPNARVKPGLRAGLLVIDTTAQTLAELV